MADLIVPCSFPNKPDFMASILAAQGTGSLFSDRAYLVVSAGLMDATSISNEIRRALAHWTAKPPISIVKMTRAQWKAVTETDGLSLVSTDTGAYINGIMGVPVEFVWTVDDPEPTVRR